MYESPTKYDQVESFPISRFSMPLSERPPDFYSEGCGSSAPPFFKPYALPCLIMSMSAPVVQLSRQARRYSQVQHLRYNCGQHLIASNSMRFSLVLTLIFMLQVASHEA